MSEQNSSIIELSNGNYVDTVDSVESIDKLDKLDKLDSNYIDTSNYCEYTCTCEKSGNPEIDIYNCPSTTIIMMEKFLKIYNERHKSSGSFFEGVNLKDQSDTNDKMETFYEYMELHKSFITDKNNYCDIYQYSSDLFVDGSEEHNIYVIIDKNSNDKNLNDKTIKKVVCRFASLCYICLLKYGVVCDKHTNKDNWTIVQL